MQLRLDAADRLVELVEERRGAVPVEEAARGALRARGTSRRAWRGRCSTTSCATTRGSRGAAAASPSRVSDAERVLLEEASFCVVDLETTGLSPSRSRICEIGAVRIERLELAGHVPDARQPARAAAAPDRGAHRDRRPRALRRAPERGARHEAVRRVRRRRRARRAQRALRHLVPRRARCCGSATGASPRRSSTPSGSRAASSPDAARASGSRRSRTSSAPAARPCHRALPDAEATAEILLHLIGLAQERGARTRRAISSSCRRRGGAASTASARSRSARRRCRASTSSATRTIRCCTSAARATFARDCARTSARSGSVRRSRPRSRPSSRSSGASLGSELEAALEELRLLRELRPPANARSTRPDRYVYLRARGDSRRRHAEADAVRAAEEPAPRRSSPRARSSRRARAAARGAAATAAQARGARRRAALRGRRAAARPDRRGRGARGRARAARAPARDRALPRSRLPRSRASGARSSSPRGRVAATRTVAPGAALELEAGLAEARRAEPSLAPEDADELLVVAQFLRRPPPELRVVTFDELSRRRAA